MKIMRKKLAKKKNVSRNNDRWYLHDEWCALWRYFEKETKIVMIKKKTNAI